MFYYYDNPNTVSDISLAIAHEPRSIAEPIKVYRSVSLALVMDSGLPRAATKRKPEYITARAIIGIPILRAPSRKTLMNPCTVVIPLPANGLHILPAVSHGSTSISAAKETIGTITKKAKTRIGTNFLCRIFITLII